MEIEKKLELLRQWRDYHWQEAFAAEGPLTSHRHRAAAEVFHQAYLLFSPGEFSSNKVPESPAKYKNLKYGEYPNDTDK